MFGSNSDFNAQLMKRSLLKGAYPSKRSLYMHLLHLNKVIAQMVDALRARQLKLFKMALDLFLQHALNREVIILSLGPTCRS